jgi:Tol biopolymer transport system component/predicted Ser/Thr protein kinase
MLGPYEVLSLIGAGGMGEVYKARDTRLGRQVAIKLLHADAANRVDRRLRFASEARAISALNHPHICALYDVGEQDGRAFLIMEYLDGETLDDRLLGGALTREDILRYGVQIASALDHAHRASIVHRDLKPSNVMLTASGAKLLDFGLAKAAAPVGAAAQTATAAPQHVTAEGTLIGTFQYMAPEQLEGKPSDARTDIFALGSLLYEMTTGRKPFTGGSQASLIASILTAHPPPVSSIRRTDDMGRPPALDHVVERCLAKDPEDRWQTARDVRMELEWAIEGSSRPAARRQAPRLRETAGWLVAIAAVAAAVLMLWRRPDRAREVTRFVIAPPIGTTIGVAENRARIALSPDGRTLAFVGSTGGRSQIWIRRLDALTAEPLPGTEGAVSPVWSPDSRFVAFFAPGEGELKKVEPTGGPVQTICAAAADGALAWGSDGTILFTQFPGGGLHRVSASGGAPVRVTTIDKSKGELNHYWPSFLPDGRRFLFMATGLDANGLRVTPSIYVGSIDRPEVTLVTRLHSRMTFVEPGYLLFVQEGALLAQRFDLDALRLLDEPVKIAEGLGYFRTLGNGGYSVSSNGVLAYQGSADPVGLTWYDRHGATTGSGWPAQNFGSLRISPDGAHVAVDVADPRIGTSDILLYDVGRNAPIHLTTSLYNETAPVWGPRGERILFRWERGGSPNLYARTIATGVDELLVGDPSPLSSEDWSADGKWIAYVRNTRQTGLDLYLKPVPAPESPRPFLVTRFDEWSARFSPDSRWLAFASTESGSPEIYVAPVAHVGEKRRISAGGGTTPRWRGDGRELFYVSADGRSIMSVPILPNASFTPGVPAQLFSVGETPMSRDRGRNISYDVTRDGRRFLVSQPSGESSASRVTFVFNWLAAVGR